MLAYLIKGAGLPTLEPAVNGFYNYHVNKTLLLQTTPHNAPFLCVASNKF